MDSESGQKISGLSKEMALANIGVIGSEPLALLSAASSAAPTSRPEYVSDDFVHGEDDFRWYLLSLTRRETFQTALRGCDESPRCGAGGGGGQGVGVRVVFGLLDLRDFCGCDGIQGSRDFSRSHPGSQESWVIDLTPAPNL